MIDYILLFFVFLIFIYIIFNNWYPKRYKFLFIISSLFIYIILFLSVIDYKVQNKTKEVLRKSVIVVYDVSASIDIDYDNFKNKIKNRFNNFNIEFIPFSNSLFGIEKINESRIYKSINDLFAYLDINYKKDEISSVILVTDGNETKDLDLMKKNIDFKYKHPLNVLYYNKNKVNSFDRQISLISYPKFISRFNKETIKFAVTTIGDKINKLPVQLKLNGKLHSSTLVYLKDNYAEGEFNLLIDTRGEHLVEIEIPVDSREDNITNNSDFTVLQSVLDEYRVLHISGHPSINTAFLRRGMQNIAGLDLISFFILRTAKQTFLVNDQDLSLIPFPTDELFSKELNNFDLIVVNDFSFNQYLYPLYIDNIKKYVEAGGSLLIFGGPDSFKSYEDNNFLNIRFSNIEDISPVYYTNYNNYQDQDYYIDSSEISKIFNFDILSTDVQLKGLNIVNVKKSATVLLETKNKDPLLVAAYYGKGKVLTFLSDGIWNLSYKANLTNLDLIKVFFKYLLDTYKKPIAVENSNIKFIKPCNDNKIYADLKFFDLEDNLLNEKKINCKGILNVAAYDKVKVSSSIKYKDKLLSSFSFYVFQELEKDEFSYVPYGKIYLDKISKYSGGVFINYDNQQSINSISNKPYFNKIYTKNSLVNIFEIDYVLFILLFIILFSFYLKSRYII